MKKVYSIQEREDIEKFRILYCEDQTGKYIMESLVEKVLERDNIKIIEDCEFLDIIEKENNCLGIISKKKKKYLALLY